MCRGAAAFRAGLRICGQLGRTNRALADAWMVERIVQIDEEAAGTYGPDRIHAELDGYGVRLRRRRFERLLREAGVVGAGSKRGRLEQRARWTVEDVVNVSGAELTARTYVEQQDIRGYFERLRLPRASAACEIGAGFGRLTVVLAEFSETVVAFERERALVDKGRFLHPAIGFTRVDSLTALPAADADFDVVLIFTVLQHMTDTEVAATLDEVARIVKPAGAALVCEHTDPQYSTGSVRRGAIFTVGRGVAEYASLLPAFDLVAASERRVEPGSGAGDRGHYMLFRKRGMGS